MSGRAIAFRFCITNTRSPKRSWLGLYFAINLQISSLDVYAHWRIGEHLAGQFPKWFYWTTWLLTWCLPPLALIRGLRNRDRAIVLTGMAIAILTLVTNKPYFGWQRHSWDPMLLGALLIGAAILLRRWLSAGPNAMRYGFTARHITGNEDSWINAAGHASALVFPSSIAAAQAHHRDFQFGGGEAGGGGAASNL